MEDTATAEQRARLRVDVFQPCTRESFRAGVWLRFAFTSDGALFTAGKELIKDLPFGWRKWDAERRAWWISAEGVNSLRRSVPAIGRAAWALEQTFPPSSAQASASARHCGAGGTWVPPEVEAAFTTLHLLPDAPVELVQAARRTLARTAHPDVGGDSPAMRKINTAADRAEGWLRRDQRGE